MIVTFYGGCKAAAEPIGRDVRWEVLAGELQRFRPIRGHKADGPAWSPVELTRPHRLSANVAVVTALVLDYDDGRPIDDALAEWEGHELVMHTSRSHQADAPRFRLVLPLARPVPGRWWSHLYRSILTGAGRAADSQCIDPARLYYLPMIGDGGPHEAYRYPGEWLDLYDTGEAVCQEHEAAQAEAARVARKRAAEIRRQIEAADPSDRDGRERSARRLMAIDSDLRRSIGERVGGRFIADGGAGIIRHAPCPACGRPDVWWPVKGGKVRCNHANSCTFEATLYDYARAV